MSKNLLAANSSDFCWICLHNPPNTKFNPCGHIFCFQCVDRWVKMEKGQTNISLDEKYHTLIKIEPNICPLCQNAYTSYSNIGFFESKIHLKHRFDNILQEIVPNSNQPSSSSNNNNSSTSLLYPSSPSMFEKNTSSSNSQILQQHFGGSSSPQTQPITSPQPPLQQKNNDIPSVEDIQKKFREMKNNKN